MDKQIHMSEVLDLLLDLMNKIDSLSCHPKNKLLIYHQFVLSKLSWHPTVVDLSKTWVVQNLDNIVTKHRRRLVVSPGGGAQKISCSSQRIVRAEGVKVMFLCIFLITFFYLNMVEETSKKNYMILIPINY